MKTRISIICHILFIWIFSAMTGCVKVNDSKEIKPIASEISVDVKPIAKYNTGLNPVAYKGDTTHFMATVTSAISLRSIAVIKNYGNTHDTIQKFKNFANDKLVTFEWDHVVSDTAVYFKISSNDASGIEVLKTVSGFFLRGVSHYKNIKLYNALLNGVPQTSWRTSITGETGGVKFEPGSSFYTVRNNTSLNDLPSVTFKRSFCSVQYGSSLADIADFVKVNMSEADFNNVEARQMENLFKMNESKATLCIENLSAGDIISCRITDNVFGSLYKEGNNTVYALLKINQIIDDGDYNVNNPSMVKGSDNDYIDFDIKLIQMNRFK